jgi:hypothetical protein
MLGRRCVHLAHWLGTLVSSRSFICLLLFLRGIPAPYSFLFLWEDRSLSEKLLKFSFTLSCWVVT